MDTKTIHIATRKDNQYKSIHIEIDGELREIKSIKQTGDKIILIPGKIDKEE